MNVLDLLEMDQGDPEWLLAELVGELLADETETPTTVVVLDDAHLLSPDDWGLLGSLLAALPPSVTLFSSAGAIRQIRPAANVRRDSWPRSARAISPSASTRRGNCSRRRRSSQSGVGKDAPRPYRGVGGGIRLAALAIHDGADPDQLLHRFSVTNTSVAEFLLEEVLDRQSEQRRDFLLTVAVLRILDPEICDAVTGRSDSADTLRTIAAVSIFLAGVERRSDEYRFHPLLASCSAANNATGTLKQRGVTAFSPPNGSSHTTGASRPSNTSSTRATMRKPTTWWCGHSTRSTPAPTGRISTCGSPPSPMASLPSRSIGRWITVWRSRWSRAPTDQIRAICADRVGDDRRMAAESARSVCSRSTDAVKRAAGRHANALGNHASAAPGSDRATRRGHRPLGRQNRESIR